MKYLFSIQVGYNRNYVVYVYLYIIHDVHLYIFSYYIRSFCLFQVQNQTLNHTLFLVCEIISIKEG